MRIKIFNQIKIGIQIETKKKKKNTRKEDHEANEMDMEKETKLKEKRPLNGFRSSHWKVVFKSIKFIALDYNSFKCIK